MYEDDIGMQLKRRHFLSGSLGCVAIACGSDDDPAKTGQEYILADGTHPAMTVPAGSTLAAENPGEATVSSLGPGAALIVETLAGMTTTLRGLVVDAGGGVGVLVRGDGDFVAENIEIDADIGVGMAVEGAASVTLKHVRVLGTITEDVVPDLVFPLHAEDASIIGIALANVLQFTFDDVVVEGFGGFGTIFKDSSGSWSTGSIKNTVGVGIITEGGAVTFTDLEVRNIWQGQIGNAISSFGVVIGKGSSFHSLRFVIADCDGFGIVQDQSTASHASISISGCNDVGMWTQRCTSDGSDPVLRITGSGNTLSGNRGGGAYVLASGPVEVSGLISSGSTTKEVATSNTGLATMADGIQVANLVGGLTIDGLQAVDNARVGLLLHGTVDAGAVIEVSNIFVDGTGDFGVVAQDGFPSPDAASITYGNSDLQSADATIVYSLPVAGEKSTTETMSLESFVVIDPNGLVESDGTSANGAVVNRLGWRK